MDDCLERTQSMVSMTKLKPSTTTEEEEEDEGVSVEKEEHTAENKSNDGGGIINQLISHLPGFESNGGAGDLKNQESTEDHDKKVDNNGGGHGLMDQFITNLPSVSVPVSSPDDPAPDSEEASLLIHIVED